MNLTVAGINYCQEIHVRCVWFGWVTIQLLADMDNVFKYSNDSSLNGGFVFVFINKKYPFISLHNLHMHINNSCIWKWMKARTFWLGIKAGWALRAFELGFLLSDGENHTHIVVTICLGKGSFLLCTVFVFLSFNLITCVNNYHHPPGSDITLVTLVH